MGVASPQSPMGDGSPRTSQKLSHGPKFIGQLLSQNLVLHKIQG